jgi:hypothetical protein
MDRALGESPFDVFAIGVGAEIDPGELRAIGRSGTVVEQNQAAVQQAFEQIAQKIEASTKSYYLLSYCSPARAGVHKLKIAAEATNDDGKTKKTGAFETEFDATGFGRGCDPNQPPNFDVTKGDALAPPKDEKKAEKREERKPRAEVKAGGKGEAKPPAPAAPAAPAAKPAGTSEEFTP